MALFFANTAQNEGKSPTRRVGLCLYVIKFQIPDNCQDDSNDKEEKSRDKNTGIVLLFCLLELALAVVGVSLLLGSSHGDKGKEGVSKGKSDTDEGTLAADEQHTREERHQDAGNEEGIRQDLDVYRYAFREKALGPDHKEGDKRFNAKANRIFG